MALPGTVDPEGMRRAAVARHYFRYPLSRNDFFAVRREGKLLGYAAAKPLYDSLRPDGRVDRDGGLDGRVAVLFVPSPVRSNRPLRVLFARVPADLLAPGGHRDWPYIRRVARRLIRQRI